MKTGIFLVSLKSFFHVLRFLDQAWGGGATYLNCLCIMLHSRPAWSILSSRTLSQVTKIKYKPPNQKPTFAWDVWGLSAPVPSTKGKKSIFHIVLYPHRHICPLWWPKSCCYVNSNGHPGAQTTVKLRMKNRTKTSKMILYWSFHLKYPFLFST